MSDVLIFQVADGGEIRITNGQTIMSDGLDVAAYLSCFGGNEEDSGETADDAKQWWGNLSEREPAQRYRSSLQNLLRTLPLTPANLQRFEEAAQSDLSWMLDSIATDLAVRATMPGPKRTDLDCALTINGETSSFKLARVNKT